MFIKVGDKIINTKYISFVETPIFPGDEAGPCTRVSFGAFGTPPGQILLVGDEATLFLSALSVYEPKINERGEIT